MSEITIGPADGWTSVSTSGHEVMVTGESAVAMDVTCTATALWICSSFHSDGERWERLLTLAPGEKEIVRVGRGYVIWARRR